MTGPTDVFIGFDSAWANNPKAPGAICAVGLRDGRPAMFQAPRLVHFRDGLAFIREHASSDGTTLVAIDQPTIVPNATGMRPAERVAASIISWLGGGVQPANTARKGMFCADAPIWPFLRDLAATEDPEAARLARKGLFVMEVFPALALASLDPGFFGRKAGPRYNPARRKTFQFPAWKSVASVAASTARGFGCLELAEWCDTAAALTDPPTKADQDRLDAALCVLIALRWRLSARDQSMMIGNLEEGYIVVPASAEVRHLVGLATRRLAAHGPSVEVDGAIP